MVTTRELTTLQTLAHEVSAGQYARKNGVRLGFLRHLCYSCSGKVHKCAGLGSDLDFTSWSGVLAHLAIHVARMHWQEAAGGAGPLAPVTRNAPLWGAPPSAPLGSGDISKTDLEGQMEMCQTAVAYACAVTIIS
jgi:hypothetical protein